MSHEQSNRELMLTVIRAFQEGDLEPLFGVLSDDVVWKSNAPRELFRFGGEHRGRAGVKEYTALLFLHYHFLRLEPRQVVARGDVVWGLFEAEARHRPSGRVVKSDIALRWILRDGRIAEHQGFFDSAGVLLQQGELIAA